MPFRFEPLAIPEVILVEARAFPDDRGFFMETFKQSEFARGGIARQFVQDNFSYSRRGTVRGLHYQMNPAAQGKLVACLKGEIYDVAVDLRRGSPTYGKWVSAVLSAENRRMLWVPEGFAHGFQALSEGVMVWYKVTAEYSPSTERGIRWDDPALGIEWPLPKEALLSPKDAVLPTLAELSEADNNFVYEVRV
ncbi:dTDP-4-dehydrorhamnose 3,5-epimerase [Meiothermus sp. QL-1]|uniref:dTDP-4-dehydrorhamnose 3,5-epimerase n=1 Tax=Meiothermus sp. QL-1 TaxID=2058095 RepID=UPI000E0C3779|nr:dTDP-4-dehydrorhamnose 3,5-epimerase [Meiothermus sp. QL-1]RDI96148.1 dTDP-4-dehydrorhamnose 3,5-epimerase [Meiothermus sp. QL-1]